MPYIRELKITYQRQRVDDDLLSKSVENASQVFDLFKYMQDETKEKYVVLHLNPQLEILSYEVAAIGTAYQTLIEPVEIYRNAMLARAHSIIVIHNHPSGNSKPSGDDSDVAKKLYELGLIHNIQLQDFADSTCKCNFDEGLKEQAAVAALRFSNTTYQRTRNELRAAYPGATVPDCRAQESRSYAG